MKIVISLLFLLVCSSTLFGQKWRDSLVEARKCYQQKSYEKSYKLYRSARKLAPKEIDLSDEVAQSAYQAGKYEEAEKIYQQSSTLKGSEIQKGNIHRQLGNAQFKQKKYDEAIHSYKQSLRENPNDEYARYNLVESMRKQKEKQQQDKKDSEQNQHPPQKNPSNSQNQPEDQKQNPKNNPSQQQKESEKNQQSKSSSNQKPSEKGEADQPKNQLSDKKTERMLDKLMKQEMETKKKFQVVRGSGNQKKSGKDW